MEPTSRGDPELQERASTGGGEAKGSAIMVAELLHDMGYSSANRKTLAGTEHPDRNAQFEHLTGRCNCNSPWESR